MTFFKLDMIIPINHMLLLLLFAWQPARAVWQNNEVMMFQPRLETAPSLGYVAHVNVLFYTPSHCLTVLWIHPLHPPWTDTPSHLPPQDLFAPFFAPYCTPSFRYWISWPNKLPPGRPPPPVLQLLYCRPQPAPQVPVGACIPAPQSRFFRIFPCKLSPLSMPSTLLVPLSTRVGSPFLVTSFLCNFLKPPPVLASTTGLGPSSPKRGRTSSSSILPSSVVITLHLIMWRPVSWCILGVLVFVWSPFSHFWEA